MRYPELVALSSPPLQTAHTYPTPPPNAANGTEYTTTHRGARQRRCFGADRPGDDSTGGLDYCHLTPHTNDNVVDKHIDLTKLKQDGILQDDVPICDSETWYGEPTKHKDKWHVIDIMLVFTSRALYIDYLEEFQWWDEHYHILFEVVEKECMYGTQSVSVYE